MKKVFFSTIALFASSVFVLEGRVNPYEYSIYKNEAASVTEDYFKLVRGKWVMDDGAGNTTVLDFKSAKEFQMIVHQDKKKTVDSKFKYRIDGKNITFQMANGNHICPYFLTQDGLKIENFMGVPDLNVDFIRQKWPHAKVEV